MFDVETYMYFDKLTGFLTQPFCRRLHLENIMVNSAYFVKSTPFPAFTGSFKNFADMLRK